MDPLIIIALIYFALLIFTMMSTNSTITPTFANILTLVIWILVTISAILWVYLPTDQFPLVYLKLLMFYTAVVLFWRWALRL